MIGVVVAVIVAKQPVCNSEAYVNEAMVAESVVGAAVGTLQMIPQNKGDESPAALDGSPYGFYFAPSKTGSKKWTINLQGGGWCYDEVDCYCRSKMSLGTSTLLSPTKSCSCVNPKEDGTTDTDCNCIWAPYLDGASFAGYREKPVPVPGVENKSATVTFRGIKNLDAVIDFAMNNGMAQAEEAVVFGISAGGLATFLHVDRIADRLHADAPNCKKIRAHPIVGFFLDHDNLRHTTGGQPNTAGWSNVTQPSAAANYTAWMKYLYTMQNLTFGADGGLMPACKANYPDEPWKCFQSPHMQDVIETPFFMLNSKYDMWQLQNELQITCGHQACAPGASDQAGVLQYGQDFMQQLSPLYPVKAETKHGGLITSCICHGCPWSAQSFGGKKANQHFADWFYGKATGASAWHVDTSEPNGNGTFTWKQCSAYGK